MNEEISADLELDLRGLRCPLPMVRVSQNISKVPVGGIVKAVTSDAGSLADITSWARSTGNEIVRKEQVEKTFVFLIKRTK